MNSGIRIIRVLSCIGMVAALNATVPASAVEIGGVRLDDTARVANQELKLNGAGIRYKAIFKVYVAGLYLADRKATVREVLAAPGAKRITIVMLREISNEELGRGFMNGIHQNSDRAEKTRFIMQLQKFGEIFASVPELKKGDMLTVDWLPSSGTLVHLNGKKVSDALPDQTFYNALLKIWLGDKPVDTRLKPALLGDKAEDAPRGGNSY